MVWEQAGRPCVRKDQQTAASFCQAAGAEYERKDGKVLREAEIQMKQHQDRAHKNAETQLCLPPELVTVEVRAAGVR